MKKVILSVCIGLLCLSGNAQNEGGFRVGLDLGVVPTNGGGGILLSLEPKYNIKDNMNVGLRIGVAAIVRDINDSGATTSAKVAANGSYVATYDYYFNGAGKSFVPYIGAGAGYYSIANVELDDTDNNNDFTVDATGKMGGLVRGGFEWGKFRMGLEYNLVPESTLQDINGNNQGTVANSYVGIHLGFYVGGGKWGK
ncbi:hypothetical protein [Flavobacterium sandaracinum]|uniref:Uncharacterized protein n=1 Tax=Flavobacterium sandaracinum TaxID=2541733 RepID=A0A4R5DBA5_9FLAO|nr:hypothetical protein [Flavobacterium sandaracinum]TDE07815.1 hypothetical protein E0F91_01670 [Flavobacterium sandaracinum]